jgi:hypothetical protein
LAARHRPYLRAGNSAKLIVEASRRNIPLALVDARVSARRFLIWRKFPGFAGSLLRRTDLCLAQTNADAQRFAKLGMRKVQVTGNLKYDFVPAPVDQSALARLLARIGMRPAWVADGVCPGEEEIAMAAHRRLARQFPDLLTVIVPHDPKRVFEIAQSAAQIGLTAALRAGDRESAPLPEIYIALAAGEAGLFLRAAGVIFAGKSLRHGGGKNPVEAARLGCAILHGPDVDDFRKFTQPSIMRAAARWYSTPKRLPSNWRSSSLTRPNCGQGSRKGVQFRRLQREGELPRFSVMNFGWTKVLRQTRIKLGGGFENQPLRPSDRRVNNRALEELPGFADAKPPQAVQPGALVKRFEQGLSLRPIINKDVHVPAALAETLACRGIVNAGARRTARDVTDLFEPRPDDLQRAEEAAKLVEPGFVVRHHAFRVEVEEKDRRLAFREDEIIAGPGGISWSTTLRRFLRDEMNGVGQLKRSRSATG